MSSAQETPASRPRGSWNVTHGHARQRAHSREYDLWRAMRSRCSNPTYSKYEHYGGRGIAVCDRWTGKDGFANFLADMGSRPPAMTLDRIDNDGNYEPGNCRWATRKEQARNKSNNIIVTWRGRSQPVCDWASEIGMRYGTLLYRINAGWDLERAFTRPVTLWLEGGVR